MAETKKSSTTTKANTAKKTTASAGTSTKSSTSAKASATTKTTAPAKKTSTTAKSSVTKSSSSGTKTNTQTKKSSSMHKRTMWGLNKISFYLLGAVAILYLIGLVLSAIDASKLSTAVSVLQALATALMICVVGVLGWRYVRSKQTVWIVLYVTFMLVIVAGIIVPMCIK